MKIKAKTHSFQSPLLLLGPFKKELLLVDFSALLFFLSQTKGYGFSCADNYNNSLPLPLVTLFHSLQALILVELKLCSNNHVDVCRNYCYFSTPRGFIELSNFHTS